MRSPLIRWLSALVVIVLAIGIVAVLRHDSSHGQRVAVAGQGDASSSSSASTTTSPTTVTTAPPATDSPSATEPPTTTATTEAPTTEPAVVETTTTLDAAAATLTFRNDYDSTVRIEVIDATTVDSTLAPGEAAGPLTLETASEHGDGASVTRLDDQCGGGNEGTYFEAGHTYLLVAAASTNPNHICPDGPVGPDLTLYDLTDGHSVVF